jgi:hypothetical protein
VKRISIAIVALILLCFAALVNTQEVMVPLDEEGKLDSIDSDLEKNLNLFTEYARFREARLFQITDTTFVLEVYYQSDGAIYKERIFLSRSEVEELRRNVTERMRLETPHAALDQEGRPELLLGALGLSLGYYGWAVPAAFGVDDAKVSLALYMLTGGGSFFAPFMITRNISVTNSAASLGLYGGTRGIAHGICLGLAAFGEDSTMRVPVASGMVVSIAEGILGFQLANKTRMEVGRAEVIGVGGDFGMGIGFGAAYLADFLEEDNVKFRSAGGAVLIGSGVGLLAGSWLADRQHYTQGDANVLRAAGFLGAYVPLAITGFADPKNAKTYAAASIAGGVLGLGMGHMLVRGKDFSSGQGRLITIGEFAGGLVGLGCAYLIAKEDADNRNLFLTSSAVGATAGFLFMYRSFAKDAGANRGSSSWNINIAPEGMLALAMSETSNAHTERYPPLIRVDFRF